MTLFVLTAGAAHAEKHSSSKAPTALQGYCPVAYVEMGKAIKGDSKISSEFEKHKYLFANADAKKMFDANPSKYRVGYDGWCATAVSMGKKMKSSPKLFTIAWLVAGAIAEIARGARVEGTVALSGSESQASFRRGS